MNRDSGEHGYSVFLLLYTLLDTLQAIVDQNPDARQNLLLSNFEGLRVALTVARMAGNHKDLA
jgi:hypothetical protein